MKRLTFSGRIRSFGYAFQGIAVMLRSQYNAWIHAAATAAAVVAGIALGLETAEWCWIVLAIVAVWAAEALNTALEFLCDVASPDFHPLVEKAKNVSAGGVLIAAAGAALIGVLVLGPRLLKILG